MTTSLPAALLSFSLSMTLACAERAGDSFQESVDAFNAGNSQEALAKIQQFLAQDPSPAEARRLSTGEHEPTLFAMLKDDLLREPAARILSLATAQSEHRVATPQAISAVIHECLAFGPQENSAAAWEAETRLVRIGTSAVPELFEQLKTREQDKRAKIMTLAEKLGPDLIIPWTECLAVRDPDLRASLLHLLKKLLSDNRCPNDASRLYALAHIQALRDDPSEPAPIREEAAEILKPHGADLAPTAVASLLASSEKFFQSEPARLARTRVGRLSLPLSQVWTLGGDNSKTQTLQPLDLASFSISGSEPLQGFVPTFSVNEIMAQIAALHALRRDPASAAALSLFACAVFAELAENRQIQAVGAAYPEMAAFQPALAAREAQLARETLRLRSMGCANLSGALRLALVHGKAGAAIPLIKWVADLGRGLPLPETEGAFNASREAGRNRLLMAASPSAANSPKEKKQSPALVPAGTDLTPLLEALDYPNPLVQYHAALALVRFDPAKPFVRHSRVIPLLARAVGDITPQAVLVATPDDGFANEIAQILETLGCVAIRATNADEALRKGREFPSKDAILLDHRLSRAQVSTELSQSLAAFIRETRGISPEIFLSLQQDIRTKGVPTWIILAEDDPSAQAAYPADAIAGFLKSPLTRDMLEQALDRILAIPPEDDMAADDMPLAAAAALAACDRRRSIYASMLPEAAKSLASAIRRGSGRRGETLVDKYRIPFIETLGRIGTPAQAQSCLQTAEDAQNSSDLRIAAIHAAGEILGAARPAVPPADSVEALSRLAANPSADIRAAAAWALGRVDLPLGDAGNFILGVSPVPAQPAQPAQ